MQYEEFEGKTTGVVIGYAERWDPSSTRIKAMVRVGTKILDINVDFLQYEFIRQEYPVGSRVTIWPINGEWLIECKGDHEAQSPEAGRGGVAKLLDKARERAQSVRKGLRGPTFEEQSAEKYNSEVEADLDYLKNSIGTIDMGGEADLWYVKREFLWKAENALQQFDKPHVHMHGKIEMTI